MPLVRVDVRRGGSASPTQIGAVVYQQMLRTLNVPLKDNFQVLAEHDRDSLIYDPQYLDISRSDGFVLIQITLNEGRTVAMKRAFYAAVADQLQLDLGIRKEDVFINLVEVKKENWSFGNGIAQYAPPD